MLWSSGIPTVLIAMRRPLIRMCVLLAAGCLGAVVVRSCNRNHDFGSRTRAYETLQKAIEEGVVRQGWLPDFLPRSAYNIREKRNSEDNTVMACCSFDPAENLLPLLSQAREVPMSGRNGVRPPAVGKRETWFPDAITEGKFASPALAGFRLYRSECRVSVGPYEVMAIWHLAINQKAGVCFFWFFQEPINTSKL